MTLLPRRSSRRENKLAHCLDFDAGDDHHVRTESLSLAPPKKRQKISSAAQNKPRSRLPRKRHGALARLVDMPIDILFEIFGHLLPLDLLSLIRTSRDLRDLLTSRSSTCVWKDARANLPHPHMFLDCPNDMSEPGYAHLVFELRCHYCFTARVKHPFWGWRIRCCKHCLPLHFDDEDQIRTMFPQCDYDELHSCHPVEWHHHKGGVRMYLRSAFVEFHERLKHIQDQGDEEVLKLFLEERRTAVANIEKRAEEELKYAKARDSMHDDDLAEIRRQRQDAIKRELCALGWEKEFELMSSYDRTFQRHPLVSQARPLTDRIWNNINVAMIKFMEETKTKRIEKERRDTQIQRQRVLMPLLKAYRQSRSIEEIVPEDADIALMAPFASILELDSGILVTPQLFTEAIFRLPMLCMEWRNGIDKFLFSLLPAAKRCLKPGARQVLELATTLFHCRNCDIPISYPRILSHKCMTDRFELKAALRRAYPGLCAIPRIPWNYGGDLVFHHETEEKAATWVLRACEMNPDETTAGEMDSRNVRFVCECSHTPEPKKGPISGVRYFMNWRRAIEHAVKLHSESVNNWTVIDGDVRVMDRLLLGSLYPPEKKIIDQLELTHWKDWACRRCITFRGTVPEIRNHLKEAHNLMVNEMTEEYYFKHHDAPPGRPNSFAITDDLLIARNKEVLFRLSAVGKKFPQKYGYAASTTTTAAATTTSTTTDALLN